MALLSVPAESSSAESTENTQSHTQHDSWWPAIDSCRDQSLVFQMLILASEPQEAIHSPLGLIKIRRMYSGWALKWVSATNRSLASKLYTCTKPLCEATAKVLPSGDKVSVFNGTPG